MQIYGLAETPFLIFSFSPSCLWNAIVPRNHLVRCDKNGVTRVHVTDDGGGGDVTDLNQCPIFSGRGYRHPHKVVGVDQRSRLVNAQRNEFEVFHVQSAPEGNG